MSPVSEGAISSLPSGLSITSFSWDALNTSPVEEYSVCARCTQNSATKGLVIEGYVCEHRRSSVMNHAIVARRENCSAVPVW